MTEAAAPVIQLNAQYVKDLSFENPLAPHSLIPSTDAPNVQVDVSVQSRPLKDDAPLAGTSAEGGVYETVLTIRAEAKRGDDVLFLMELSYGGLFSLQHVPAEELQPFLLIEAPRLLFPFARAIVSDATREGGFPPLLINPINFVELYQRQMTQPE